MKLIISSIFVALLCPIVQASAGNAETEYDKFFDSHILTSDNRDSEWADFMKHNDLVWDEIDSDFFNGAYIGDGVQGAMIMRDDQDPESLRMLMGRYDLIAHYKIPDLEYCDQKLFAGSIILKPSGNSLKRSMRLDIFNGIASGQTTTDKGQISWRAFCDRKHGVFIVEANAAGDENQAHLFVRPEWGISPIFYLRDISPEKYKQHLPPKPTVKTGVENVITQKLFKRGAHAVASRLIESEDKKILFVAIGTSDENDRDAAVVKASDEALKRLRAALADGVDSCAKRHQQWWRNHMKKSYISIPQDAYWQRMWWLQMYKFASASAEDSPFLIDNQGPWVWNSSWGGIWWNYNVQTAYAHMFSSNRLDVGRSMINGINRIYDAGQFHRNSVSGVGITVGRGTTYEAENNNEWSKEYGNLTWVLFNYWKYWQFTADDEIGRRLYPILADNIEFLISKLEMGNDGKLHMTPSRSPEYSKEDPFHKDTNYALMGLRWGLQTLLDMNREFSFQDERESQWKKTLDLLVDFPVDEKGYRVNADQSYEKGHRHFSHLLAIYPYHTVTIEQGPEVRDLIERSIKTWIQSKGGLTAWSHAVGAAMLAVIGEPEKAIRTLDKTKSIYTSNGMYFEGGGPVLESALTSAETINYMLLQSWGDTIRVFPAIPERWQKVRFNDLRAKGAFLISGVQDANERVVRIKSLAGKPLKIMPGLHCPDQAVHISGVSNNRLEPLGNGIFKIELNKGETAMLYAEK